MTQATRRETSPDSELQSRMRKLDELLEKIQRIDDPAARDQSAQIIQSLMEFHGAGIARMLERIAEAGELGQSILSDFAQDELVSNLLLLYGLHPLDIESRVRMALEKVRPYLSSHGGNVELISVSDEGVVQLQMQGSCHGCPSSMVTLKTSIEQAILEKAPDATSIEVAGLEHSPVPPSDGFVPVEMLTGRSGNRLS